MLHSIESQQTITKQSDYAALNFTSIGDYKMGKHLGAGAYASVKQAVHSATGMLVAVKIYDKHKIASATRKKSVLREVTVLQRLDHPNVLKLYDVIDSPSQLYLVMEFLEGENLSTHLKRTALTKQADKQATQSANDHSVSEVRGECLPEPLACKVVK